MEYEVITVGRARAFYEEHRVDEEPDLAALVETREIRTESTRSIAERTAGISAHQGTWLNRVRNRQATDAERNRFEAEMAGPFFLAFNDLPVEVVGDPDFWRYLGLGPLRWYTLVCDLEWDKEGNPGLPESSKEVTTPSTLREHPVLRTFLRGQMCFDATDQTDPFRAALVLGDAASKTASGFADRDAFKSHLIRVQLGSTPELARAFLNTAADPYMPSTDIRKFIKYFRRSRTTRSLELLTPEQSVTLARELRSTFDAAQP
jgi:hypothetical protein